MDTKRCSRCKQELPITAFCKDKHSKDGHYSVCKACDNAYQKAWREKRKTQSAQSTEAQSVEPEAILNPVIA